MSRLRVTLRRSLIGHPKNQGKTARTLGLGRVGKTIVCEDNAEVRGMVDTIRHLVTVEQVGEGETG